MAQICAAVTQLMETTVTTTMVTRTYGPKPSLDIVKFTLGIVEAARLFFSNFFLLQVLA